MADDSKSAPSVISDALAISALSAVGYCLTIAFQFGAEKVLSFPATTPHLDPVHLAFTAIIVGAAAFYVFIPYGARFIGTGVNASAVRWSATLMSGAGIFLLAIVIYLNPMVPRHTIGPPWPAWSESPVASVIGAVLWGLAFSSTVYASWTRFFAGRLTQMLSIALSAFVVMLGCAYFVGYFIQMRATFYNVVSDGPYRGSVLAWINGEDYLACEADLVAHTVSHRCVLGRIEKEPLRFEERETGPLRYAAGP